MVTPLRMAPAPAPLQVADRVSVGATKGPICAA